ncbi:putative transmembrane protein [Toxoplasma gondii p89]|uniref:Putative transmembrane protein n=1 Tax=Toxoplasma gondii p89 TaxID=943119 RepID=A0A086JXM9_TOXGO|nr:putative transmembrane protein [Toxoplasma gondii p89]
MKRRKTCKNNTAATLWASIVFLSLFPVLFAETKVLQRSSSHRFSLADLLQSPGRPHSGPPSPQPSSLSPSPPTAPSSSLSSSLCAASPSPLSSPVFRASRPSLAFLSARRTSRLSASDEDGETVVSVLEWTEAPGERSELRGEKESSEEDCAGAKHPLVGLMDVYNAYPIWKLKLGSERRAASPASPSVGSAPSPSFSLRLSSPAQRRCVAWPSVVWLRGDAPTDEAAGDGRSSRGRARRLLSSLFCRRSAGTGRRLRIVKPHVQGLYNSLLGSKRLAMDVSLTARGDILFTLRREGFFKRLFSNLY